MKRFRFYWRLKVQNGDTFSLGFDGDDRENAEQQMLTFCRMYKWSPVEYEGWDEINEQK